MKRALALALLFVTAIAGRTSAQTVITACVKVENGQARFVAAGASCSGTCPARWDQQGPRDPPGQRDRSGRKDPGAIRVRRVSRVRAEPFDWSTPTTGWWASC
jgi:hypothetical protein